jgi:outer membrane biosynthesis protein TonB
VNKTRPSERLSRLLAFVLSGLLYVGAGAVVFSQVQKVFMERPVISRPAINLSFAQMELQAAEPPPEPKPVPEADLSSEALAKEEPEPVPADAQVVQEAAAPENPPAEQDILLTWVYEQIEREKYYPASALRAGYEGTFELRVSLGTDGIISGAEVLGGKGHPLLRHSLEKVLGRLIGRSFGQPLPQPVELPFEFQFKLN